MTEIIMATKDWILLGHCWLSYSEGNYNMYIFFGDNGRGIANSVLVNLLHSTLLYQTVLLCLIASFGQHSQYLIMTFSWSG